MNDILNSMDNKILYELDKDGRVALGKLSKLTGLSKQNLIYRLKRFDKLGIIKKYTAIIDIHKLGLYVQRIHLRFKKVDDAIQNNIIKYFSKRKDVIWIVSLSGSWDMQIAFFARNPINANNVIKEIKQEIGEYISKLDTSTSIVNYHLSRDYLIDKKRSSFHYRFYGFEPSENKLDDLDKKILQELSSDCRQNSNQLGIKLNVSYHTIQARIKSLQESGIIQGFRTVLDTNLIGREYYKIILSFDNLEKETEKNLFSFLSSFNFITYIIEVLGSWDIEIECEVVNSSQIDKFLQDLKNKFPDLIKDYNTLKITKEHKLDYFRII